MNKYLLLLTLGLGCLAFDSKDEPPPPPPVGHTVYCLTRSEVVDAIKLWMQDKKLPITGEVTVERSDSSYLISASTSWYSNTSPSSCTPTPTPSKETWLKVKVEYQPKGK